MFESLITCSPIPAVFIIRVPGGLVPELTLCDGQGGAQDVSPLSCGLPSWLVPKFYCLVWRSALPLPPSMLRHQGCLLLCPAFYLSHLPCIFLPFSFQWRTWAGEMLVLFYRPLGVVEGLWAQSWLCKWGPGGGEQMGTQSGTSFTTL